MISKKTKIGKNVEIHPLALIEDGVEIDNNTKIG
jgi:UDP-3-O-[3-hydroxymyristoyl] glucosamine N-acyltransferase